MKLEAELSSTSYHYKRGISEGVKSRKKRRKRRLTGESKQRRATNERERTRLNILNDAYKQLRSLLPLFPGEEKTITKVNIVKTACKTIFHLEELLEQHETQSYLCLEDVLISSPQSLENDEICNNGNVNNSSNNNSNNNNYNACDFNSLEDISPLDLLFQDGTFMIDTCIDSDDIKLDYL